MESPSPTVRFGALHTSTGAYENSTLQQHTQRDSTPHSTVTTGAGQHTHATLSQRCRNRSARTTRAEQAPAVEKRGATHLPCETAHSHVAIGLPTIRERTSAGAPAGSSGSVTVIVNFAFRSKSLPCSCDSCVTLQARRVVTVTPAATELALDRQYDDPVRCATMWKCSEWKCTRDSVENRSSRNLQRRGTSQRGAARRCHRCTAVAGSRAHTHARTHERAHARVRTAAPRKRRGGKQARRFPSPSGPRA
jgi:hypothetical protein